MAGMDVPSASERRLDRGAFLASVVLSFLAFTPALGNGFVVTWDDGLYVLRNEHLRELSLSTIGWAFTDFHANFWCPLTWLSFSVDHALWGLDPFGFHLTNAVLHALDAGLVFALARALFLLPSVGLTRGSARAGALLAALVWSLHPLRVESVAWVTERKDVLGALFGISATLAYLRHAAGDGKGAASTPWRSPPHALALTLYALSLCAKPTLVALPFALLVLDWVPLRRIGSVGMRRVLLEKVPWLALAAAATGLTALAHSLNPQLPGAQDLPTTTVLALSATWEYLRLFAWPASLSPFHLNPGPLALRDPAYLLRAAGALALIAACLLGARRRPGAAAAGLAFLALVAPGLASVRVSSHALADRFTYLPAIPLSILVAGGLARLVAGRSSRTAVAASVAGAVAVLAILLALTVRQIPVWRDDVALWTRAIDVRPHASGWVYFQRALAHEQRGSWPLALADVDEAIAIASARGFRGMCELYAARARFRASAGDLDGAVLDYRTAIVDVYTPAHHLPWYRSELAAVYRAQGRPELAEQELRLAGPPGPRDEHARPTR
jgi:hypothetical protein